MLPRSHGTDLKQTRAVTSQACTRSCVLVGPVALHTPSPHPCFLAVECLDPATSEKRPESDAKILIRLQGRRTSLGLG